MTQAESNWPPLGCPVLEWPDLSSELARLAWYAAVISAYKELWAGHSSEASICPVAQHALDDLENRLGCRLPPALVEYHRAFGALELAERLCSVEESDLSIQPLMDAFPGIVDLSPVDDAEFLALASELVVFCDYLGNGNMFCFHKKSGEVYYFDHDSEPLLSYFFPSVHEYLDGLMIRSLAEIHDAGEHGEDLLVQRFGETVVRKWLY